MKNQNESGSARSSTDASKVSELPPILRSNKESDTHEPSNKKVEFKPHEEEPLVGQFRYKKVILNCKDAQGEECKHPFVMQYGKVSSLNQSVKKFLKECPEIKEALKEKKWKLSSADKALKNLFYGKVSYAFEKDVISEPCNTPINHAPLQTVGVICKDTQGDEIVRDIQIPKWKLVVLKHQAKSNDFIKEFSTSPSTKPLYDSLVKEGYVPSVPTDGKCLRVYTEGKTPSVPQVPLAF